MSDNGYVGTTEDGVMVSGTKRQVLRWMGYPAQLQLKDKRIKELENILKDFLTTKECHRTWVDEMHGTIAAVLEEGNE